MTHPPTHTQVPGVRNLSGGQLGGTLWLTHLRAVWCASFQEGLNVSVPLAQVQFYSIILCIICVVGLCAPSQEGGSPCPVLPAQVGVFHTCVVQRKRVQGFFHGASRCALLFFEPGRSPLHARALCTLFVPCQVCSVAARDTRAGRAVVIELHRQSGGYKMGTRVFGARGGQGLGY